MLSFLLALVSRGTPAHPPATASGANGSIQTYLRANDAPPARTTNTGPMQLHCAPASRGGVTAIATRPPHPARSDKPEAHPPLTRIDRFSQAPNCARHCTMLDTKDAPHHFVQSR